MIALAYRDLRQYKGRLGSRSLGALQAGASRTDHVDVRSKFCDKEQSRASNIIVSPLSNLPSSPIICAVNAHATSCRISPSSTPSSAWLSRNCTSPGDFSRSTTLSTFESTFRVDSDIVSILAHSSTRPIHPPHSNLRQSPNTSSIASSHHHVVR